MTSSWKFRIVSRVKKHQDNGLALAYKREFSLSEEGTIYYYTSPRKSVKEEWCRPMRVSVKDARWGMPDEIVSENRPQFVSDQFYKFSEEYDFKHITGMAVFCFPNNYFFVHNIFILTVPSC